MAQVRDLTHGEWIEIGDDRKFVFSVNITYVYIYAGSLLSLSGIDAIVNPTDANLSHRGGVAAIIAKAAGAEMTKECESQVRMFGKLQVKENFVSTAGDLPYKGIVHVVGPSWGDYHGQRAGCAEHLYKTVINALMKASSKGWTSVAIPAIGSGGLGIPNKLCAEMYLKAFIDFAVSGPTGIRQIHLVDTNKETIQLICSTYENAYENEDVLEFENAENYPEPPAKPKTEPYKMTINQPTRVVTTIATHQNNRSSSGTRSLLSLVLDIWGLRLSSPASSVKYSFTTGNLTVHVYKQSITTIQGMDGIVNSTVNTLKHSCGVAKVIANAAGATVVKECNDYVRTNGNLKVTENFTSSGGNLPCSGIIHAVGPQWDSKKKDECARNLYLTLVNVLTAAKKRNWTKIAMTAMSSNNARLPRDVCTTQYVNAFKTFSSSATGSLTEVHFIDINQIILNLLIDEYKKS